VTLQGLSDLQSRSAALDAEMSAAVGCRDSRYVAYDWGELAALARHGPGRYLTILEVLGHRPSNGDFT
jgi:hypothetical protein